MKNSYARALTVFVIALAMPLFAQASDTLVKKEHYSGFLKDYSQLKEEKDAKGNEVMRYISPALTSGKYHKVMIDRVVYYPAPKPDPHVDMTTLNQIRDYLTKELRQKIGAQVPVVNQPGPDVIRMHAAITAVKAENAALKAYQYIPIALIFQGIKAAAGTRAKDAELYVEMEILDSESGKRLGAVVRKGVGTEVKEEKEGAEKGKKMVMLDNVKPILDNWADLAAEFVGKNLKAK